MFARHIATNLASIATELPRIAIPTMVPASAGYAAAALGLAAIGLILLSPRHVPRNLSERGAHLLVFGTFLPPGLTSIVVIYPRGHYLFPLCILTVAVLPLLLSSPAKRAQESRVRERWAALGLVLLALVLVAMVPSYHDVGYTSQPNLSTIRAIRSLSLPGPVNAFAIEGPFDHYAGGNIHHVEEDGGSAPFAEFRTRGDLGMIVASNHLLRVTRFKHDAEWQDLLVNPSKRGFAKFEIPDTDGRLLVRVDLLDGRSPRPNVR